jgi:hypothetical protein
VLVGGAAAALVASLGGGGGSHRAGPAVPPPDFGPRVSSAVAAVGQALAAVAALPVQAPPPVALYDVVANTGGDGVRYRSSPSRWCGGAPPSDPCWNTVVPGPGAAEGDQVRVYCYAAGAAVHGDTWWALVSVSPAEYVPAAFLRSAARYSSVAPPPSLRC